MASEKQMGRLRIFHVVNAVCDGECAQFCFVQLKWWLSPKASRVSSIIFQRRNKISWRFFSPRFRQRLSIQGDQWHPNRKKTQTDITSNTKSNGKRTTFENVTQIDSKIKSLNKAVSYKKKPVFRKFAIYHINLFSWLANFATASLGTYFTLRIEYRSYVRRLHRLTVK